MATANTSVHALFKQQVAHYDYLPDGLRARLNAHLATCAECAAELTGRRLATTNTRPPSLQAAEPRPQLVQTPPPPPAPPYAVPADEPAPGGPFPWQRLLLPLALALLFVASLWAGMRGDREPARIESEPEPPAIATDTVRNRVLPIPSAEVPLTIDASGHVTITFACDEAALLSPEYHSLVEAFEAENTDISVRAIGWQQAVSEWQSATGALAGGSHMDAMRAIARGSDVFCSGEGTGLAREGLARDLAPLARADAGFAVDEFYPAVLERVSRSGSLYLIPVHFRPALIYYDPAAFGAAGLRVPRPGWSWDDLLSTATALTLREGTNTSRWGFGENYDNAFMQARFWSAVGTSQPASSLAAGNPFEQAAVRDLFRWHHELYLRARAAPVPRGITRSSADAPPAAEYVEQVRRGRFAMWLEQPGSTPPRDARVAPFPVSRAFDNTTPFGGIEGWAVSADALHVEAAWRWVSFMSRHLPVGGDGTAVPARRSPSQMQAFWAAVPPADREAYEYALEHLGEWPEPSASDGTLGLWNTLLAMIRGETTLPVLIASGDSTAGAVRASDLVTLTFAAPRDQKAGYEQAAVEFTRAHPAIRVRVVAGEDLLPARAGTEILWSQMRTLAGRVDAMVNPQVVQLVRSGRSQGILLDLTSMISQSLRAEDYYPNTLEGLQWRGRALALPGRVGPQLIHYNKWMFDQQGVAYPRPGWTWTDFDRILRAVALRVDGASGWWGLSEGIAGGFPLLNSRSGPLVEYRTDPPAPLLDQARAVEAAGWYAGLVKDELIPPAGGWASEAAMWIAPAELDGLEDLRKAGIGVAPFPAGPGSTATTPLEIYDAFAISASTPHREEAWQWLLHLQAQPPAAGERSTGLGARRGGNDRLQLWEDDELRAVVEYALEHSRRPAPLRPEEYLVTQQLLAALERIVEQGEPPDKAMKAAQAAAQRDLGRR